MTPDNNFLINPKSYQNEKLQSEAIEFGLKGAKKKKARIQLQSYYFAPFRIKNNERS